MYFKVDKWERCKYSNDYAIAFFPSYIYIKAVFLRDEMNDLLSINDLDIIYAYFYNYDASLFFLRV